MDSIINFFRDVLAMLPTIKFMDIIDILLVTFVLYTLIMMIQTTGAARIAKSIVLLLVLAVVTKLLNMYLMSFLLDRVLEIGLIALVIMFQPELRRMLEKIGSKSLRELLSTKQEQREIDRVIGETVNACEIMSRERTGVLIVFERETSLIDYQKTGTVIDARVSSELLRNLFFTKASLHDGAVIIRNERIAAAGCVLPLTQSRNISSDLGTRHRAGIGMSEVSDAVVVIVSEETGTISVAVNGMLKRHLAPQTLNGCCSRSLRRSARKRPIIPSSVCASASVARTVEKKRMIRMQKHKILSFLLALLVSIGLWVYAVTVVNPNDKTTVRGVRVRLVGTADLESNGLMVTGGEEQYIDVEISGSRSDLKELNSSSLEAIADVSNISSAGDFDVSWTLDPPSNIASGDIKARQLHGQ